MIENNQEAVIIQLDHHVLEIWKDTYLYNKLAKKMRNSCRGYSGKFELVETIGQTGKGGYDPIDPRDMFKFPCGVAFDQVFGVLFVSEWTKQRLECFECFWNREDKVFSNQYLGGFSFKNPNHIMIEPNGILNENSGKLENALIVTTLSNEILKFNIRNIIQKLKRKESLDNLRPEMVISLEKRDDDEIYFGYANSAEIIQENGVNKVLICVDDGALFGDLSNGTRDSFVTRELYDTYPRDSAWLGDGKLAVSDNSQLLRIFKKNNDGIWIVESSFDVSDITTLQRLIFDEINSILYVSDYLEHKIHSFDLILKKKIGVFELKNAYAMEFIRNDDCFILVVTDFRGAILFFK